MSIRCSTAHRPSLSPLLALLLAAAPLAAQVPQPPPAQPGAEEKTHLETAGKKLDAYATVCWKNGYPRKAREVWLEVIGEYDSDDAAAREQLGFQRNGTVWQRRADFDYPDKETPNPLVARNLQQKWDALAKELADIHRNLAQQLEAAGKPERAKYHFDRVLRFQSGDPKAQQGAGLKSFEGLVGTELDMTLLKRSRVMDRAITRLTDAKYKVEPCSQKEPHLDAGGKPYSAVKSEHFVVYGDWDAPVLMQAAEWAERSLAFCAEAFAGYSHWPPKVELTTQFAFFKQRATWVEVVKKNAGALGGASAVDFIVEHTGSCSISSGKGGLWLSGQEDEPVMFDYVVRMVAEQYSMIGSDGLREGIGHAIVGMFFGRNLILTIAREEEKKERTVAGGKRLEQKLELPDMETWKTLATELAFQRTSLPTGRLPLIKAAHFPVEARIKAWSVCDYLMRRDPEQLLQIDRTASKARNENEVKFLFAEATKQSLDELEEGWRKYWTEDTPIKRAINNKVTPLEAASKDAPLWLDEFNRLRKIVGAPEVGWSSVLSTDCKMHGEYLKKNKGERGPDKENIELAGKDGFTNAGRSFAETALVWTRDKEPKKAMEHWLELPGYRDALVNHNIDNLGLYVVDGIAVLDVARGRAPATTVKSVAFPANNVEVNGVKRVKDPVPAGVDVEQLGPEVAALLKQNGHDKQKQVGYPLSYHFFHSNDGRKGVTCEVTANKEEVKGVLVYTALGKVRRSSAPGMWVFYPFEPLKKGVEIRVHWTLPNGTQDVLLFTQ